MAKEKDDGYIRFNCRACGKRLKVRSSYEGGTVMPCPKCGGMVNVPIGNIDAVAEGTMMEETGQPGRLNVDRERLMARLRGEDEERTGPGSVGGPPSLKGAGVKLRGGFQRVPELDQLAAAIHKIDDDAMGQVQRIYRDESLSAEDRDEQVRQVGVLRRGDLLKLLQNRLGFMRERIANMERESQKLSREEWTALDRLKTGAEALELYARHVLGVQV